MHVLNKKQIFKRGVAALAAALMVFQTPLGHITAYAQTGNTVSGNEMVSENSVQEQVTVQQGDLALNYAYIENASLEVAEKQNIVVSAGEGNIAWESATLTLKHDATGETAEIPCTDFTENVMQFSFDTSQMQTGVYRVSGVKYSYKEETILYEGAFDFAQISGMEQVCFGLGTENPLPESEFTEYNADGTIAEEELIDVDVVTLNGEKENLEASQPVAQAVEEAVEKMAGQKGVPAERGTSSGDVGNDRRIAGSLVVYLDPGHDETHAGARANGLEEENLTFKVATYCKEYLEDNYTDVVVYMSHNTVDCPYPGTTSTVCNANRVEDAYQKGADVYVSLHFNTTGTGSTTASGAIVFYPNGNYDSDAGSEGMVLAAKIIQQLQNLGLVNGNPLQIRNSEDGTLYPDGSLADYYGVIRRCKEKGIPAVIVEHAFLNNAQDAAFLMSEDNLKKLGIADAKGIAEAYNLSTEEVEFDAEDLQVTEIDGGNGTFKITLSGASPVNRIANIKFKVYPTSDKTKEYMYTAELADKKTGTYTVTGNVGQHGKKAGKYKVIAYAFDAAGKKTQLRSTTFTIEKADADTTGMRVTSSLNANEKVATVKLKGAANVKNVYFKVYSVKAGEKKTKKYAAEKLSSGNWQTKFKISEFKKSGDYVVKAYVNSYFGGSYEAAKGGFTVEGPTSKKIQVTKMNMNKGTFRVLVKGAASKSGVKKVSFVVKAADGKKIRKVYSAKKAKSGYYYVDVDLKKFGYQYGTYELFAKVKDGNGIEDVVAERTIDIEEPTPVLTAKLKSYQRKLVLTASNLGFSKDVKGVRFKVVPTEKTSAAKTYTVKTGKDGVYSTVVSVDDFAVSGKYKVTTYVKRSDGKYRKVGKVQVVTVSDVEGGKVKIKKKSSNANYLLISGIEYKGKIEKVQVKAWPVSNKKAKVVYKATAKSDGSYRVLVDSKKHKGIGGEYKYQIIVTTANGIEKRLVTGKMTLGKSEAETPGLYAICGDSNVTVSQMMRYYKKNAGYPFYYATSDAPTLKKFCQLYYKECEKEEIRAEVAFAQAMHETNFLRYGGDVSISQFNFAGLGATGGGVSGNSFATVQIGIRAHVQHLKAYASTEPLNNECVDPRFGYVTRGTAPYVEWLAIPDNPYGKGWATDVNYTNALKKHISALINS